MGLLLGIFSQDEEERPSKQIKRKVKRRDNYTCQRCGRTSDEVAELHVHHIRSISKDGTNKPENLITLCDYCHSRQPAQGHQRIRSKTPPPISVYIPTRSKNRLIQVARQLFSVLRHPSVILTLINHQLHILLGTRKGREIEAEREELGELYEEWRNYQVNKQEFKKRAREIQRKRLFRD